MHFRALDSDFNATAIIDAFDSMIWTEKYSEPGDFELHGPNSDILRSIANNSSYIFNSSNASLMVIENPSAEYDEDEGDTITIKGRSIISILDRRVLQKSFTILNAADARVSKIIYDLIVEAFGPTDPNRHWSKLQVINSTSVDSVKLPNNVGMQFNLGDNLLEVVKQLCSTFGLGIKAEFSVVDKVVKFIIYEGNDLSIQGENRVLFSDLYDNLLTAKDEVFKAQIKNAILVAGSLEDETTKQPKFPQMISDNELTGLNRRETFLRTDQEAIVYNSDGTQRDMTEAEYIAALRQAGTEELNKPELKVFRNYDGEILETTSCHYGTHFNLGDIVAFGLPHTDSITKARIEEITFSDDASAGKTLAPKFNYAV
jgi:hypothetical protein